MQFFRNMFADPSNAFHYTPYKKYWIGSFVAVFGERFRFIASGWLVVQLTNSPAIEQSMVFGEGKNYLVALIVPSKEFLHQKEKHHFLNKSNPTLCQMIYLLHRI